MKRPRWSVRSKIAVSNALVLASLWILTFVGLRLLVFRLMDVAVSEELRVMANSVVAKPAQEVPNPKNSPLKSPPGGTAVPLHVYIVESSQVKPTSSGAASRLTVRPTGNHKLKSPEPPLNAKAIVGRTDRPDEYVVITDEESLEKIPERSAEPFKAYETPLLVDGTEVGIVRATYPLDEINRLRRSVDAAMRVLFPAGLVLVAAYGWWSTGRALRPVKRITEAAAEVSGNNLSYRFPIGPDDEFARLAHSFNHMFDRLEHSFEVQAQFVSDASHELRTPLAVVKGNLSWLAKNLPLTKAQQEPLDDALGASIRMQLLIDDLLYLAKTDASLVGEVNARSNVAAICSDCVTTLLKRDPSLSITLDVSEAHFAQVKAEHLHRILLNLIDNACRYGQPGTTVTVSSRQADRLVFIAVENQGEVIAPEVLARLGERFYRPDDARSRSTGGTGLGLAISKRLCEMYGGTCTLSSSAEAGTVAELRLPVPQLG